MRVRTKGGLWAVALAVVAATGVCHGSAAAQAAEVTGTWELTLGAPLAGRIWTLEVSEAAGGLTGTLGMGPLGSAPVEPVLAGNELRFQVPFQAHGMSGTMVFTATLEAGALQGRVSGMPAGEARFVGRRTSGSGG